jgi:hypothetical protein
MQFSFKYVLLFRKMENYNMLAPIFISEAEQKRKQMSQCNVSSKMATHHTLHELLVGTVLRSNNQVYQPHNISRHFRFVTNHLQSSLYSKYSAD